MRPEVEEGICQVMSHFWLTDQLKRLNGNKSSSSSSSSSSSNKSNSIQARLGEFYLHQISTDSSPVYGDGYRHGFAAVQEFGLSRVLEHLRLTANFPWTHTLDEGSASSRVFGIGNPSDRFRISSSFCNIALVRGRTSRSQQLRSRLLELREVEWFLQTFLWRLQLRRVSSSSAL